MQSNRVKHKSNYRNNRLKGCIKGPGMVNLHLQARKSLLIYTLGVLSMASNRRKGPDSLFDLDRMFAGAGIAFGLVWLVAAILSLAASGLVIWALYQGGLWLYNQNQAPAIEQTVSLLRTYQEMM